MKFPNGDVAELRIPKDGAFVCPVCGAIVYGNWPYYEIDDGLGVFVGSHNICGECETEFGTWTCASPKAPIGTQARIWKDLRIEWLDRTGWRDENLMELHANLGVDVKALMKDCGKLKGAMEKLRLKFANGDVIEMMVPESGGSFCPICGEAFFNYMPYDEDEKGFATGRFDPCPNCEFVFGHSDMVGPDSPPGTVAVAWNESRRRWLNRKGWAEECVQQIESNLQIDIEALRVEGGENISRISYWSKRSKPVPGKKIRVAGGQTFDRKALEAGAWICPVCGAKLYSAWLRGEAETQTPKGRFDTCPSCEFVTEESDLTDVPPERRDLHREEMRITWLTKNSWSTDCVSQLKNLGIDVAELKKKHQLKNKSGASGQG